MPTPETSLILAVYFGLLIAAILYNRFVVEEMEKRGVDGYEWAQVVGGVAFTIAAVIPLIGWTAFLFVLGAFAASGTPMVVGAIKRHEDRIQRTLRRAHERQAKNSRE
jgi:hypothetical protein